jgi:hypothetical protein
MRLVGAFMNTANDSSGTFVSRQQGLREASWIDGRNARVETYSAAGDAAKMRKYTADFTSVLLG